MPAGCLHPPPGSFLPAYQMHLKACHGIIQAAVTTTLRAAMLTEAPVASREGTVLPGYLTCLPGKASWGVRLTAPHVKDPLLPCWTGAGRSGTLAS